MEIDMVQCTVKLMQKDNNNLTTIVKAGPSACSPAEMVLLRMEHDAPGMADDSCCIGDAVVVGTRETSKQAEYERLVKLGFKSAKIEMAFPGGRGFPTTLAQVDLPAISLGAALRKEKVVDAKDAKPAVVPSKASLRAAIQAAGIELPAGNLSEADLRAIAEENNVIEAA